jgi:hypothetical protein
MSVPGLRLVRDEPLRDRRRVRYAAAAASALTAVLYFGIGAGVLEVVDEAAANGRDMVQFGVSAGAAFVVGTILLLAFDRRLLWLLGALLQLGVVGMYFAIATQRTPSFEVWGVLIKVLQLALLAGLVYLVARPRTRDVRP